MRVKIRPLNEKGRPTPKSARIAMETYEGELSLREDRSTALGRAYLLVVLTDLTEGNQTVVRSMKDAMVLWIGERAMRIRGFEEIGGAQYGQTWEVEVI